MLLKDISFLTPEENILFDDVLLHLAEQGTIADTLRFWESDKMFVVLGRTGKLHEDVYIDRAKDANLQVLRRSSGGGTVIQGPGCVNFTLVLSKKYHPDIQDLRKSYRFILGKIITALDILGVKAVFKPISDLALLNNEKKISGNAQHRGRNYILHHGTLLYNFDLGMIEKFLKIPRDVPDYRAGRSHLEFVSNIPLNPGVIKKEIRNVFEIDHEKNFLTPPEEECLKKFRETRKIAVNLD